MHQPSSNFSSSIQAVIDGQEIGGMAYFSGSSDLEVMITRPFEGFTTSVHMPYFARGAHPEGFRGEYGQARALQLLGYLYVNHKNCACRRRAALPYLGVGRDFSEYGRTRFLVTDPGHPTNLGSIGAREALNADISVQIEKENLDLTARFYDIKTGQPFLAEGCLIEYDGQAYVQASKADSEFMRYVEHTRQELLPHMVRYAALLESFGINQRQLEMLQSRLSGLTSTDAEDLLRLGYLRRELKRSQAERFALKLRLERQLANALRLEASGRTEQAAPVRKRAKLTERQLEATVLKLTSAGMKVVERFPEKGVVWEGD